MEKYTSNQPNAAILLQSLRSAGYDNYSAIADLIDNAFDANADAIKVEIGSGKPGEYMLSIADNGDGMDEKILDQALRLGSMTERDEESLGKYGMGLITASISIGRKLTVITKREGKYITGIHDLAEIEAKNDFVKEIRPSTETEQRHFDMTVGLTASGTIVNITDIDNLQNHNLSSFATALIKNCGEIFRDFLNANKVLTVNRKVVMSSDPMMRADSGTSELLDKSNVFTNEDGVKSTLRIRIFMLPSMTSGEAREKKINIPNQGFYLMRNNRQVAKGKDLNVFTKHNNSNRFRAEIYFDGSLDKMVGVNFRKQNISLFDELRSWVESVSYPHITYVVDTAKKAQVANRSEKTVVDHTPTQRTVASRKTVLKKPKFPTITDTVEAESGSVHDISNFANVEYREESNTHLAPLYRVAFEGEKMVIRYNIDHVFYQTVFLGAEENKDLVNAIDSLIYSASLALIGVTSSESTYQLKDEFLDNLSDNLRTLMS
jgi:hypothetical protein